MTAQKERSRASCRQVESPTAGSRNTLKLCWTKHSLSQDKEAAVWVAGHSMPEPACPCAFPVAVGTTRAACPWGFAVAVGTTRATQTLSLGLQDRFHTGGFIPGWTSHTIPAIPAAYPTSLCSSEPNTLWAAGHDRAGLCVE